MVERLVESQVVELKGWYRVVLVVAVSDIFFLEFSPQNLGKMVHFDDPIFSMGWLNHQPG